MMARMMRIVPRVLICILVVFSGRVFAAASAPSSMPATLPQRFEHDADVLASKFSERLHRVRYMESDKVSDVEIEGWKGFPTKRYTYSIKDKDGAVKTADVVMLNPTAKQIARW